MSTSISLLTVLLACFLQSVIAFAPASNPATKYAAAATRRVGVRSGGPHGLVLSKEVPATTALQMIDPIQSTLLLAETEAWVKPAVTFLDPFLNLMSFAMLARVVLSWYPKTNVKEVPWIFLVLPTEPLLRVVKGVVPPAFGVDITPVFWLAIFTFIHEILLGQQGLLTMKIKYGI